MDSFDGSWRREGRSAAAQPERRPGRDPGSRLSRDPEPLEQRLDRWMSTGRQLVEGVAGGRPGSRPTSRRGEGRPGPRAGFDGLGRWVENRLDWLLDDSDDWPEPWQEPPGRRGDPQPPAARRTPGIGGRDAAERPREPSAAAGRLQPQAAMPDAPPARRRLEAISRRGAGPAASSGPTQAQQDWPDDETFTLSRWQRPANPPRRPDPLQLEQQQRQRPPDGVERTEPPARPLPRSSRRR